MDLSSLNERLSNRESMFMIDVSDSVYRQSNAVAQSDLKLIKSKSLYHYKHVSKTSKETDALIMGRAIHKAIFEYDKFDDDFLVRPKDMNLRTKAGREQLLEMQKDGHSVLTREQMTQIKQLVGSIKRRRDIYSLIEGSSYEMSHFIPHNERIMLKCRTDGYNPKTNTITDLKSCIDASPRSFTRDIFKYGYHFQNAFYIDIIEKLTGETPRFVIIALEKSFPFEACLYELSPKSVAIGRRQYREELEKLDNALVSGYYPSYENQLKVTPPKWLENEAFSDLL